MAWYFYDLESQLIELIILLLPSNPKLKNYLSFHFLISYNQNQNHGRKIQAIFIFDGFLQLCPCAEVAGPIEYF